MAASPVFDTDSPVAWVTGSGAARVGNAVAWHLGRLGYRVALHANSSTDEAAATSEEMAGAGIDNIVLHGAVDDWQRVEYMVREIVDHYQRLDVLVNCAAIWHPTPLEEVTEELVRHYLEVNTLGSFAAARAAGLQMVTQPQGGAIVNIGDWALVRPYLNHAAYFPSKGAIPGMTRSLAVELGHRNPRVRVNCILPGPVLLGEGVGDELREEICKSTIVRRIGTPEHVAHAVQFLIENDFVTGVCLPVDGGRTIYANDRLTTDYQTG